MKLILIICFPICFIISSCSQPQNCVDDINKLPMYGRAKKCNDQIEADKKFIAESSKTPQSKREAISHILTRGWQYLYSKKLDTSMMRFNQAWLLDSLNAEVYWGFGNLLGIQGKFKESIPFFERSIKLDPSNAKVWGDASTSYGNAFFQTKNIKYLNSAIYSLKKAIEIDPHNAQFYGQLTSAYCYFTQKDSARKYLKITDQLDHNAIGPETRKILDK